MRRLLFAIPIVLLPNALQVPISTGIPGMNFSNLLLLLLLGALAVSPRDSPPAINRMGYLTPPLLLLFASLTVGYIIAQSSGTDDAMADATRLKNAIFYPLFYFVYRRCGLDLQGTRQMIMLVMLVAVAAGIQAIVQGLQFGVGQYLDAHRASGPFGGIQMANRAGAFYAMFLPMLAATAVVFQRKSVRVAALIGCVLLAAAILFTYSRQSYLIALVGLLILLMHRSVLAAVLAGALLVASVSLFPESVVQRVQETRQMTPAGASGVDQSTASRMEIWTGAMEMWREHPAGVGLGRFPTRIGEYSAYPNRDAHNSFVLILAESGPLALSAMLWLLWRLWRLAFLMRRSAPVTDVEMQALTLGFKIAVVSMALSNMFGSPFFEGLIMANFWVLCGLLERYSTLKAHAAPGLLQAEAALSPSPIRIADRFPLVARAMPGAGRRPPQ